MSTGTDFMQRLAEPFAAEAVEWRVQSSGKTSRGPWVRVIPYVTNRAIMDRLDAVAGPGNWTNRYEALHSGLVCGISIRIGDQWVTKWDGADMADEDDGRGIDRVKMGCSNAMKRAAVQWGIGRYLYDVGEHYAEILPGDSRAGEYLKSNPAKHGDALRWAAPKLDAKFLPPAPKATPRGGAPRPMAAVVEQVLPPSREAALATAAAALPPSAHEKLPGSKSNLLGFGGQELYRVPREHLPEIRAKLLEIDSGGRYDKIIGHIDNYLEATRAD